MAHAAKEEIKMSIEGCFEREMECLENDLGSGAITREEYDKRVRELEAEMRELEKEEKTGRWEGE